jgi:hypothetical protein
LADDQYLTKGWVKQVGYPRVKKGKMARKTLKKYNKVQHNGFDGTELVRGERLLPSDSAGQIVGKRETPPAIFRDQSGSGEVHLGDEAAWLSRTNRTSSGRKACAGRDPAVREI